MKIGPLLILVLLALPARAEVSTDSLIEKLAAVRSVGGNRVGYGGGQSEFHRLFVRLRPEADEPLVQRLLSDRRPVCRAMGLVLFTWREGTDAIPGLRERLADVGSIDVFPRGCVGTRTTIGGLARSLLGNANYIADYDKPLPLLSKTEFLALDLDIVIRNDTGPIHEPAASDLRRAIGAKRLALDLPGLRKLCPRRNDTLLVRGVGRLVRWGKWPVNEIVLGLLVEIAADGSHHDDVRLAAASGIARSTTKEARKALAPLRPGIRKAGGNEIIEEWVRKVRLLDAIRWERKVDKTAAVRLGDPTALPVLENLAAGVRHRGEEWPKWAGATLLGIVARVERGFEVWDTRGDFPLDLSWFLSEHKAELEKLIGKEPFRDLSDRLWRLQSR